MFSLRLPILVEYIFSKNAGVVGSLSAVLGYICADESTIPVLDVTANAAHDLSRAHALLNVPSLVSLCVTAVMVCCGRVEQVSPSLGLRQAKVDSGLYAARSPTLSQLRMQGGAWGNEPEKAKASLELMQIRYPPLHAVLMPYCHKSIRKRRFRIEVESLHPHLRISDQRIWFLYS